MKWKENNPDDIVEVLVNNAGINKPEDFDKPKAIITATNEFIEKKIDWDKTTQD